MARRRFRRKDLKRPDQFVSGGRRLLEWSHTNTTFLWRAAAVAGVVFVVVVGVLSVRGARVRQASEDLGRALTELRAGHYADAATRLGDVAERWKSTEAGRVARLYAASADLKADNVDKAIAFLQQALESSDLPPYLRQQACLSLAFALEKKGDTHGAAERYAQALALEGPYTAAALLGEARAREQLGEKDQARQLYERFVRDYPQAPEVEIVNAKLGLLSGQA